MSSEFDVEVVHARLNDFSDLAPFAAVLTDDERARADAYKIPQPRDVFILARGLLRLELGTRSGMDAGAVRFDVRASGKPDLRPGPPERSPWRFSVSHTGPDVAIAFALGVDVGVDIESLERVVKPLEIAGRYFTPREFEALRATPEAARSRAFLSGWTRKEAIVKARGHTMAESLNTLSVDLDPTAEHPGYEDTSLPARPVCRLTAFTLPGPDVELVGAVALRSDRVPRLRLSVPSARRFD